MFNKFTASLVAFGSALLLLATAPTTSAAPVKPTPSVCDTGHRGNLEYDRKCLSVATRGGMAKMWGDIPEGKPARERNDMETRRNVCKFAGRNGGVRAVAKEMINDVAFDSFHNYRSAIRWFADAAQGDCLRMGYSDPVSGLVPVNLRTLPKGDCWVELSYADKKRTKINAEVLCKG